MAVLLVQLRVVRFAPVRVQVLLDDWVPVDWGSCAVVLAGLVSSAVAPVEWGRREQYRCLVKH